MGSRTLLRAIGTAAAVASIAACTPSWVVRARATPDPFTGKRDFVLLPIAFAGVHVGSKTEERYLADKDDMAQRAFYAAKTALNAQYSKALIAAARQSGMHLVTGTLKQAPPFLIQPQVTSFDPGAGANWPSDVKMVVRLSTIDGTVLDTIEMTSDSTAPSAEARLANDSLLLGRRMASYLGTRVGPLGPEPIAPAKSAALVAPPPKANPDSIACWSYLVVTDAHFDSFVPPAFPAVTHEELAAFTTSFPYLHPLLRAAAPYTALRATGAQLGALAWQATNKFVTYPGGVLGEPEDVVEVSVPPQTSTVGFRLALLAAAWSSPTALQPLLPVGPNVAAFSEPVHELMASACAEGHGPRIVVVDETDHEAIFFP